MTVSVKIINTGNTDGDRVTVTTPYGRHVLEVGDVYDLGCPIGGADGGGLQVTGKHGSGPPVPQPKVTVEP